MSAPDMPSLANMSVKNLRNLTITQVEWNNYYSIAFTLSDGQKCKAGSFSFLDCHTFNPSKKITRIECIIDRYENWINQMKFYHHGKRLVTVGIDDDDVKYSGAERVEVFSIAEDEQLIGCKLDHNDDYFLGVTWIKTKQIRGKKLNAEE